MVTGFSFSSYLNLVRLGVPEDDISTILMADYGLKLYGNAVIVNTDYAAANGDTVKAFLGGRRRLEGCHRGPDICRRGAGQAQPGCRCRTRRAAA